MRVRMSRVEAAHWEFTRRFRRGAFGWKSQPAIERVRQAVSEIKTVARRDAVLAAEGAVLFLERVSPALEQRVSIGIRCRPVLRLVAGIPLTVPRCATRVNRPPASTARSADTLGRLRD